MFLLFKSFPPQCLSKMQYLIQTLSHSIRHPEWRIAGFKIYALTGHTENIHLFVSDFAKDEPIHAD